MTNVLLVISTWRIFFLQAEDAIFTCLCFMQWLSVPLVDWLKWLQGLKIHVKMRLLAYCMSCYCIGCPWKRHYTKECAAAWPCLSSLCTVTVASQQFLHALWVCNSSSWHPLNIFSQHPCQSLNECYNLIFELQHTFRFPTGILNPFSFGVLRWWMINVNIATTIESDEYDDCIE